MSEPTSETNNLDTPEVKNSNNKKQLKKYFSKLFQNRKKEKKIVIDGSIFVSLIPDSHKKYVEVKETKAKWTSIFGLTIMICIIASLLMFGYNLQTQSALKTAQEEQNNVDLMISKHAEVHQAMESEKIAKELLYTAAGNEINWESLVGNIQQQLPEGTTISSFAVTNGSADSEVSSSIVMNLSSDSTFGYSDSLDSIEGIDGVLDTHIGGLSIDGEGRYVYQVSFIMDNTVLTNEYTKEGED